MNLLQRMDRLVYATRLDRVLFKQIRPRTLRWTPVFVLVALIAGFVLMARSHGLPQRSLLLGWLLFYGACVAAAFLRFFGPRLVSSEGYPLDEREMVVKMRAYALSGVLLSGLTMLGCFYMASVGVPELWHPNSFDWINLGFGIQAGAMLLPTWIASWTEARSIAGEDD